MSKSQTKSKSISIRLCLVLVVILASLISAPISGLINHQIEDLGIIDGKLFSVITFIITIIINPIIILLFTRYFITKKMNRINQKLKEIQKGDFSPLTFSLKDEFSEMAENINQFSQRLGENIERIKEQNTKFSTQSNNLYHSLTSITNRTEEQKDLLQQVSTKNDAMVQSFEETNTTLSELTTSIEDITSVTQTINDKTTHTAKLADGVKNILNNVSEEFIHIQTEADESTKLINNLNKKGEEITSIVSLINGIAQQTNLLALNAAIEAARAGENGKGFAVVADEVRKLADESLNATNEISTIIATFNQDILNVVGSIKREKERLNSGEELFNTSYTEMDGIVDSVKSLSNEVDVIYSSMEEMSAGIREISTHVNQIVIVAENNNDTLSNYVELQYEIDEVINTEKENASALAQSAVTIER